ncbi:hypothetical protein QBC37DRAFT_159479 [Rhypophila decipiens]|uniref:Uncharacterized protein n=1 Tax=Rhypophila decipiens TaxID=261697 RepID=A0AAN6XYG5_9PEZI|nr:hypothetical protein QBC37DRAFT_159479 [Rhypophila decipiens]
MSSCHKPTPNPTKPPTSHSPAFTRHDRPAARLSTSVQPPPLFSAYRLAPLIIIGAASPAPTSTQTITLPSLLPSSDSKHRIPHQKSCLERDTGDCSVSRASSKIHDPTTLNTSHSIPNLPRQPSKVVHPQQPRQWYGCLSKAYEMSSEQTPPNESDQIRDEQGGKPEVEMILAEGPQGVNACGWGFIIWQVGVSVGLLEQWQSWSASLRLILRGRTRAAASGSSGVRESRSCSLYHWLISKLGLDCGDSMLLGRRIWRRR